MSAASPSKDVSAKDIVSGIISAANRKMLRAATSSGKTPKKDSVDSVKSSSGDTCPPDISLAKSNQSSRRNSESVLQSAMAIAAAVPQLVVQGGKDLLQCLLLIAYLILLLEKTPVIARDMTIYKKSP